MVGGTIPAKEKIYSGRNKRCADRADLRCYFTLQYYYFFLYRIRKENIASVAAGFSHRFFSTVC